MNTTDLLQFSKTKQVIALEEIPMESAEYIGWAESILLLDADGRWIRILAGLAPTTGDLEVLDIARRSVVELKLPLLRDKMAVKSFACGILEEVAENKIDWEQALDRVAGLAGKYDIFEIQCFELIWTSLQWLDEPQENMLCFNDRKEAREYFRTEAGKAAVKLRNDCFPSLKE